MLKFLLIIFIVGYFLYRVGGVLFKILSLGGSSYEKQSRTTPKRPPGSNVDVDFVPQKGDKKDFKGGEYVDYEELK